MAKKLGVCRNYAVCDKASNGIKIEADEYDFVCDNCGRELREYVPERPRYELKPLLILLAIVIGLGGFGAFLYNSLSDGAPSPNGYLQAKRQRYASQEQFLQALIADINKENQHATTLLANTKEVIAQDLRKIESIDQAYKANRVSLAQAKQEIQSVDDNRAVLEKALAGMKEKEQSWRQVAGANPSPALDQELRQLQGNIAALEQELRTLVERRNVSAVG